MPPKMTLIRLGKYS